MSNTSIKGLIQDLADNQTAYYNGVVKSVDPLKVRMHSDIEFDVGSALLIKPEHIGDLEVGDKLGILSLDRGRTYFIMGKVG